MACAKADELPPKIQRELAQYVERFNEWKKMCSVMNRLDKVLKEYMIGNNIDFIEDEGVRLSMAHPTRWMLDQSLIVDIDQYKVKKTINVLCPRLPRQLRPEGLHHRSLTSCLGHPQRHGRQAQPGGGLQVAPARKRTRVLLVRRHHAVPCAQEAAGEEALRHRGERLRGAAEEKHFLLCAAQQPRHLRAHLVHPLAHRAGRGEEVVYVRVGLQRQHVAVRRLQDAARHGAQRRDVEVGEAGGLQDEVGGGCRQRARRSAVAFAARPRRHLPVASVLAHSAEMR
mmetsp:Transcript_2403/g.6199  ORF Transcript_2403/g.6199 Transcript_2403/m.6199 type:complete len:284 (-) Transcript_2403:51-902(-)